MHYHKLSKHKDNWFKVTIAPSLSHYLQFIIKQASRDTFAFPNARSFLISKQEIDSLLKDKGLFGEHVSSCCQKKKRDRKQFRLKG